MQPAACIWAKNTQELEDCVTELLAQGMPQLNIYVACPESLSVAEAADSLKKCGIVQPNAPMAYASLAAAKNALAKAATGDWLLFINAALLPESDFLTQLYKSIAKNTDAVAIECRQLPYEQEHPIDPVSLKTPTLATDVFAVKKAALVSAGGFDGRFAESWADRDISLRLRTMGELYFAPLATAIWQTEQPVPFATLASYINNTMGQLLFACKYLPYKNRAAAKKAFIAQLRTPKHFDGVRKALLTLYLTRFPATLSAMLWRVTHAVMHKAAYAKYGPNNFVLRGRATLPHRLAANTPAISVVIRTAQRPQLLQGALQSLANQTLPPTEIIVVEDGPNTSEEMLKEKFSFLPIRYHSTKQHIGRGRAGNTGMQMASGEYLNLLDDDDYFYPDHLELMADAALRSPNADLILGCAMTIEIENGITQKLYSMRFDRLNVFTMSQQCQIPIQSALFKKSLFKQYGGLREDIDGNEDWAMWMRYLMHAKRPDNTKGDIGRATSVFVQPAGAEAKAQRLAQYKEYNHALFGDDSLQYTLTMQQLRGFYDDMIADTLHLRQHGLLDAFLDREQKRNT